MAETSLFLFNKANFRLILAFKIIGLFSNAKDNASFWLFGKLINTFGTLEELLKKAHTIKQNKRRETLIENKDKAILSKKLVTLKKDVPTQVRLEDFILKNVNKNKLYSFLREMECNRLLSSAISTYGEADFDIPSKNIVKNKNLIEIISLS